MTDYTVKELLKGFYGERQVRKTEEEIRKAIGIVKNGMKEYLEALEEVPDLDINSLDRNKCSLLQNAVSGRKWDIAKDLVKDRIIGIHRCGRQRFTNASNTLGQRLQRIHVPYYLSGIIGIYT